MINGMRKNRKKCLMSSDLIKLLEPDVPAAISATLKNVLALVDLELSNSIAPPSNELRVISVVYIATKRTEKTERLLNALGSSDDPVVLLIEPTAADDDSVRLFLRFRKAKTDFMILPDNQNDWLYSATNTVVKFISVFQAQVSLENASASLARSGDLLTSRASELRNCGTGVMNAKKIAKFYGISQRKLALAIGVRNQSLTTRPCSVVLQPKLAPLEYAASLGISLFKSPECYRAWLSDSTEGSESLRPIDMIKDGRVLDVVQILERKVELIEGK